MDERDLANMGDEAKSKIVQPMRPGDRGWQEHWAWLARNGNRPDDVDEQAYLGMLEEWQEYVELDFIWGEA